MQSAAIKSSAARRHGPAFAGSLLTRFGWVQAGRASADDWLENHRILNLTVKRPWVALCLWGPGGAGMTEILLGVLTEHLAFVTANGAFDNNFGSGSRRSVHVGWSHRVQATRFEAVLQDESMLR